jgi:hypothetical protein
MDQLDAFREKWQAQSTDFPVYNKEKITNLLANKSSSIVKWLLIIAIIEFCFFGVINFVSLGGDYHQQAVDLVGAPIYYTSIGIQVAVVLYFIFLFWRNYINISVEQPTRTLMNNIMKTRKTMKWYIWFNLGYLLVFSMFLFGYMLFNSPDLAALRESPQFVEHPYQTTAIFMLVMFVFTLIMCGLMWLFYFLIYGLLLRKLKRNYNELKRIEQ